MTGRRALILGATGTLGHVVAAEFRRVGWEVAEAVRDPDGFDASRPGSLAPLLDRGQPEVVVNCVGLLVGELETMMRVNGLFPVRAGGLCAERDILFVQVSSDAVFSGERGGYREDDLLDATEEYGLTKVVGETTPSGIVVRTSFVGPSSSGSGLLHWALHGPDDPLPGYTTHVWSGMTTLELAQLVEGNIRDLRGACERRIVHAASEPLTKHELLCAIVAAFDSPKTVVPTEAGPLDRSLIPTPGWDARASVPEQLVALRALLGA